MGRTTDGVTSLPAHAVFLEGLADLRRACRANGRRLSIVLLDLDRFRDWNERHSPSVGDSVLAAFAAALQDFCSAGFLLTRYLGDQFMLAFAHEIAGDAVAWSNDFRRRPGQPIPHAPPDAADITLSLGIVESAPGCPESEHELIRRARTALEQAKHEGGNRTVLWERLLEKTPTFRDVLQMTEAGARFWTQRLDQQIRHLSLDSMQTLVAAVEARDPYTQTHSLTVAGYCDELGRRLRVPSKMLDSLRSAALLHDIGKIGIPDAILMKPGPLTPTEYEVVKKHPRTALQILQSARFLGDERPMILHHHERMDGKGYPAGLASEDIPMGARILAVADAVDTMLTPRVYKKRYSRERVRGELQTESGRQFDPVVAAAAVQWLDETAKVDSH